MSKCGSAALLIPPRGADDVVVGLGALTSTCMESPIHACSFAPMRGGELAIGAKRTLIMMMMPLIFLETSP
jgi:hypothetical protein